MSEQETNKIAEQQWFALAVFALCPLLLKSGTLLSGMLLGVVSLCVVVLLSLSVSMLRCFIPHHNSWVFILIISATWITVIDLLLQVYFYQARLEFGIYISLLAVNAALLVMQEQYALRQAPVAVLYRMGGYGLVVLLTLVFLGAVRELLGSGALFSDAHLYSSLGTIRTWQFVEGGALLLNEAAGAFICLGLFVAAFQYLRLKSSRLD